MLVPPSTAVSKVTTLLTTEEGTASRIKSSQTRSSVQAAIRSAAHRVSSYRAIPDHGLAIFTGYVVDDDGKERKVVYSVEPPAPIPRFTYRCDSRFHVEAVAALLETHERFGFIITDGKQSLFGTLAGNTRAVLTRFTVELPNKHGRGGQSANRFQNLREEARHNYLRKICETAVSCFIDASGERPNVSGLILAGSADFKNELRETPLFDQRLRAVVLATLDVAYGGINGFNQAITLAAPVLSDLEYVREKAEIEAFFEEIATDSGLVAYGLADTMRAFEDGAAAKVILWQDSAVRRVEYGDAATGAVHHVVHKRRGNIQATDARDENGVELDVLLDLPLVDYFVHAYRSRGAELVLVSDQSEAGTQFVRGFGGVGAILRYAADLTNYEAEVAAMADDFDDIWGDGSDDDDDNDDGSFSDDFFGFDVAVPDSSGSEE